MVIYSKLQIVLYTYIYIDGDAGRRTRKYALNDMLIQFEPCFHSLLESSLKLKYDENQIQ